MKRPLNGLFGSTARRALTLIIGRFRLLLLLLARIGVAARLILALTLTRIALLLLAGIGPALLRTGSAASLAGFVFFICHGSLLNGTGVVLVANDLRNNTFQNRGVAGVYLNRFLLAIVRLRRSHPRGSSRSVTILPMQT